ncbi:DUF1810 domain-containing protein [Janthinobacterium sp. 17J80-10]|uniref:DUF1810 domain-containing protein n=1 Tax=Janthinobacterium sp. 17J80-10 TaxID=2497863 RepID=UPI0010054549|nr:DUF1810 domain-containing protein [Janthinobacterium sp. 17J80-10]QAU33336.1 DUF1810 domain-containing protein [Janthinobacterium sp. 17J80-10]
MSDADGLQKFVLAQNAVYDNVLAELRAGRKRSHWMWFIFPQIKGLGHSAMARQFALASLDEAHAYLCHPVLGTRLRECTSLAAKISGASADEIFGYPDHMKFHSSMTLFAHATEDNQVFTDCLHKYFEGKDDVLTLAQLRGKNS